MVFEGDCDCGICLSLVTANLQCPRCAKLFCRQCLENWLKTAHSCPSCRFEDTGKFEHNGEAQADIDARVVRCDYCDSTYTWANRNAHLEKCEKANICCPFEGCTFKGPENVVDVHTMGCPFGQQYTMTGASVKQEEVPEKYHDLLSDLFIPPDEGEGASAERGTLVHYIQDGDTLAGICVKYDCTVSDLRRLNKLVGDSLIAHVKLTVPKPRDWDTRRDQVHVPVEALIALRKKRLTKEMMAKTSLTAEEAVAYLHVVDYNLKAAITKFRSDSQWAEDNDYSKPQSLREFMKQQSFRSQDFDGARGGKSL